MIFQLIIKNVGWYQYIINALIVILGRTLDIISTRYVTRELKLETNALAQRIGWKGMILMQSIIVILGSLDFYLAFFIFIWSLFLFANNIEGSWYVKEVGESEYYEELKGNVKRAETWRIIFAEMSYILNFSVAGVLILIFLFIFQDYIAIIFICLALICQGVLGTVRSLLYLLKLRKNEPTEEES
ncbi:MAG: hypothetical protein ACTSR8_09135 [Promethearchaeota archaeon]